MSAFRHAIGEFSAAARKLIGRVSSLIRRPVR
jgi:hypothetical protein